MRNERVNNQEVKIKITLSDRLIHRLIKSSR